MTERVAVIGGGIAGASAAAHLADADVPVTVFERGDIGAETTARSAAFFGFYGTDVERRMKRYAMARYNDFLADPRADPTYDLIGRLRVATTADAAAELEESVAAERARDPGSIQYRSGEELKGSVFLPELDPTTVAGASYRPHVGYFDPRELALEFAERARDRGAAIRTGVTVEEIVLEDGRARGVMVDGERIAARAVVCAAGPWNPAVAATAGLDLPVTHSPAPILKIDAGHLPHTLPIVTHVESGVYVRGHGNDAVLVGHYPSNRERTQLNPGDLGDRVPDDLRAEMRRVVRELFPPLADASVEDEWVGIRSHTPDGEPIVGWTDVEGLSVVAFNSSGIQLSPAAGDVVARQLADGDSTEYHDDLSIVRFDGYRETPTSL